VGRLADYDGLRDLFIHKLHAVQERLNNRGSSEGPIRTTTTISYWRAAELTNFAA
jgi:hypothetical protein